MSSGICLGLFSLSQVKLCKASSLLLQSLLLSLSELKNFRYADKTLTQPPPPPQCSSAQPPHFLGSKELRPSPVEWDHTWPWR